MRQHAYGMSNQTFGKWMGDALKAPRGGHRRERPLRLDPVLLPEEEPAALVALHGPPRGPLLLPRPPRRPDLDRAPLQQVRPDEGQGPRDADPGPRRSGRHRGRPRLRGQQERRHQGGQRLRHRPRRHEAHRPLGHHHRQARRPASCSPSWATRWGTTSWATSATTSLLGSVTVLLAFYLAHRPAGGLIRRFGRDVRFRPALGRRGAAPAAPAHERRLPGHRAPLPRLSRATRSTRPTDSASRSPTTTTPWRWLS